MAAGPALADRRQDTAQAVAGAATPQTPPVTAQSSPAAQSAANEIEKLGQAVRRLASGIRRMRGRQICFGGSDMSFAQFELLSELAQHDQLSAGELAALASLTPATVSGMLDGLVARGYVSRTRSEDDRRVVACELTKSGRHELAAHTALKHERWQNALAGMPDAEVRAATRVLTLLCEHMEESLRPASQPADGV
jgi:DNA-binding MarR family transcriptional regulator